MSAGKHTPGPAAQIQRQREAEFLANHKERIAWLEQDAPKWACGAPVPPSEQFKLLAQSREAIAKATGGAQ